LGYLETGKLYRAVAAKLLDAGQDPQDVEAAQKAAYTLTEEDIMHPALREETVGNAASIVSAIPEVRAALLEYQQRYAARPEGAVLDGRDIGTVICPQAEVKLFITATDDARAQRRFKELQAQGDTLSFDAVLQDMRARDARDANRNAAPLVAAADALTIDTSAFTADEVFEMVVAMIQQRLS